MWFPGELSKGVRQQANHRLLPQLVKYMIDYNENSIREQNPVDWNDPQLQKLLGKTDGWSLDNREVQPRRNVQIKIGWQAASCRPAVLVWKRESAMVIETAFTIPVGEYVRIDTDSGDSARSLWGVVAEARPGRREQDAANGIHIHWLHAC